MSRRLVAVLAAASLSACSKPQPVDVDVRVQSVWVKPGEKIEATADGAPVALEPIDQGDLRIKTVAVLKGSELTFPVLRFRHLTSCGWEESTVPYDRRQDATYAREALARREPLWQSVTYPHPTRRNYTLSVDNRDGKARSLKVGAVEVPLKKGVATVDAVGCAAPVPVSVDGRPIGELAPSPASEDLAARPPWVFIDPTGKRCYAVETHAYVRPEWGGGGKSAPELLAPATLHPRPEPVDYVLTEAPSSIMAELGVHNSRLALRDAKCP